MWIRRFLTYDPLLLHHWNPSLLCAMNVLILNICPAALCLSPAGIRPGEDLHRSAKALADT